MIQKTDQIVADFASASSPLPPPGGRVETIPQPLQNRNDPIANLIEAGHFEAAKAKLRSRHDPRSQNALGVCLLRTGQAENAVRVFRSLVLDRTGLFFKEQAPIHHKTNFAYALMMSGHIVGGLNVLGELKAEQNSHGLRRLREAVDFWKSTLSWRQRIGLSLGLDPNRPFAPPPPVGDLF